MWFLQLRSRFFLGRRIGAPVLAAALFMVMGLLFFGIGLFVVIDTQHFLQRATAATTAVVVECDRTEKGACTPTLQFKTPSGETITVTSSVSSTAFEVGQQMPVVYDPHHPQEARMSSWFALWLFPSIFLGVGGVLFLLAGSVTLWLLRARGAQWGQARASWSMHKEITPSPYHYFLLLCGLFLLSSVLLLWIGWLLVHGPNGTMVGLFGMALLIEVTFLRAWLWALRRLRGKI